ncbi:hypothetical protein Poli38472_008748 [Pythium oligandrum]|uniref:Uncharacterized protein n=1 Tax=Pythium oligandrum TaxID=41045 RepID=A0A8K1FAB9_PYTOL|nr:hypothetical protein Poli38472_008748 [Pythium oligandrum]|eukprot:TMW56100.1 hypothetical protein Poli38472_008748 [Pythium oligandrum]
MHRRPGHGEGPAPEAVISQRPRGNAQGGDPALALVKELAGRAWQSPKVKTGVGMWAIGMFFMLLAPALWTVTPEMKVQYETMVIDAANLPGYQEAYVSYTEAQAYADEAKVWFWRFREPYNKIVPERQRTADKLQAEVERLDAIREQKMKHAKAYVGLWSDFGMAEVRQRFWDAYDRGKVFAQQQTFYHMLMHVLTTRDEEILSTIINWVFVALTNFTTGLLGSLFYFFFSLISMVYSYQPDPFSATAFVILAFVGGASVIASYLVAIYGMVASGAYVVSKAAVRSALEQEQRQRLRYAQR